MAVVFDLDGELQTGRKMSNDDTAAAMKKHSDVLIGFGSIDPNKGLAAIDEARRCVEVLGLKGFKLHPAIQRFAPNDERFYPLWDAISSLKVPALFHTGFSGIGTGMPGGDGIKLRYTQPLLLDDVAADFPSLTIIGAHPSWPWQEEMLSIARHKGNVFIDLSGWAPKYFPPSLVQQASTLLQDKCLFGTDFPLIPTERWLSEFAALPIKDEARPKIMVKNAARILGLDHLTGS
jgi:predicted TIM-barrel fold metal-dependent hydrolase